LPSKPEFCASFEYVCESEGVNLKIMRG